MGLKEIEMKPVTYFKRWGFSINEGGTPFNIHMSWNKKFFMYMYFFGKRIVLGGKA
jgi:hypothetical protein